MSDDSFQPLPDHSSKDMYMRVSTQSLALLFDARRGFAAGVTTGAATGATRGAAWQILDCHMREEAAAVAGGSACENVGEGVFRARRRGSAAASAGSISRQHHGWPWPLANRQEMD